MGAAKEIPRVYSLVASSSSRPAGSPAPPQWAPSKAPAQQPRRAGRLTAAARARRLLPWGMLLLAGASMLYEAVVGFLPVDTHPGSKVALPSGMGSVLKRALISPGSEEVFFPELRHHFRQLPPGSSTCCGATLGEPRTHITFQRALQACLGHPRCTWVSFHPANGSTQLCAGHSQAAQAPGLGQGLSLGRGAALMAPRAKAAADGASGGAVLVAVRRGCEDYTAEAAQGHYGSGATLPLCLAGAEVPGALCPAGQAPIISTESGMACDICGPSGHCGELGGAGVVAGFNEALQRYVGSTMQQRYMYRAFNPSLVAHRDRRWVVARVSNATNCGDEVPPPPPEQQGDGSYISNHVLLCPLREGAMLPEEDECRYVNVDVTALAAQQPGLSPADISGLEDARAFALGGRLYLLSFFYRINGTQEHNIGKQHRLRWYMPEAGRRSYMFAARLGRDLQTVEQTTAIICPELKDKIHKNWMPLVVGGTLYLATHAQPLTVVKADLDTGSCEVVSRETALGVQRSSLPAAMVAGGTGGDNVISASGKPTGGSLAAGSKALAVAGGGGSLDAAFRAVLGGRHVHGGAPFTEVEPGRFLSIVHHGHDFLYGRIYSHHWILVQPSPQGGFETAWLSEAFRLPEPPSVTPAGACSDVQFASGLLLVDDTLYISYGSKDCHSLLAAVPSAGARLQEWLRRGLGTQAAGGRAPGRSGMPVVKWEAPLFGRAPEPFDAATAVVSRWLRDGRNATAHILVRHLKSGPDEQLEWRNLGASGVYPVHLVDSNNKANLPADVVVTQGRLGQVHPAAAASWIPYVTWQGPINATHLGMISRHATELWVPTSFHQEGLLRVGASASQVHIMPRGLSPGALCPAGLPSQPRPATLGGAKGFIFLHTASPQWQNGAGKLLEAYSQGFTTADNVTLVLHVPPGDRYQHGAQLEELKARVAALERQPGAPHVLLIADSLSFGRQLEKLVAAVDAVVQPYLAGEPSPRDLLLPMSCGKPVITTEGGPASDLVGEGEGYLVRSEWGPCNASAAAADEEEEGGPQRWQVWDEEELVWVQEAPLAPGSGAEKGAGAREVREDVCREVDPDELAAVMRRAYADTAGRQARGAAAAAAAQVLAGSRGWDAVAEQAWGRVEAQMGRGARRQQPLAHRKAREFAVQH